MFYEGRFSEALKYNERAIGLSPKSANYHNKPAAALPKFGRTGEAGNQCEEAIKLDPNYIEARDDFCLFSV